MSNYLNPDVQAVRAALFTKCESMDQLHDWIEYFLGIDMPGAIIDPTSNSSPMALIWEIYEKAKDGRDPDFQQVLAYSARDGGKTLAATILEVLCFIHLGRNVGHLAAIKSQSMVAQRYVKNFFKKPPLSEFVTQGSEMRIEVAHYVDPAGLILTPKEWEALDPESQNRCKTNSAFLQIVIATVAGCNSLHSEWVTADELDLADPEAYAESKYIPAVGRNGELPITFLTSTRKYAFGLVQKEIDAAHETGMQIRHWNIIDVTEQCHPLRHRPDLPKKLVYISEYNLNHKSPDDYELLSEAEKLNYQGMELYHGCSSCKLAPVCKGRLATAQTSKSRFLKPIDHVINKFRQSSVEKASAQLMCWKPSREGMIYPRLSRELHMKTAAQMAEMITGDHVPAGFTKAQLIQLMISRGITFHSGLDWGFTHAFAVTTGARDGHRFYVLDQICITGLELDQKLDLCKEKLGVFKPLEIWPDTAYPADIKTFRRHFKMREHKKDVPGGIEAVRMKLNPGLGKEPELYFLAEDEGVELLFSQLMKYHFKIDTAGNLTDIPDDTDDDACDSLRYDVQNVFQTGSKLKVAQEAPADPIEEAKKANENWMTQKIQELTGHSPDQPGSGTPSKGRKGSFSWNF